MPVGTYEKAVLKDKYAFRKLDGPRHGRDLVTPGRGMVLIQRDTDTPETSDSNLVLPRSAMADAAGLGVGRILALGMSPLNADGTEVDTGMEVGQLVLYEQHRCQGQHFDLSPDKSTMLLQQQFVVAVLEDIEVLEA